MKKTLVTVAALLVVVTAVGGSPAFAQDDNFKAPQATVPQRMDIEGEFVRIAYNNEGWATLGYRMAQESVGQKYMLLSLGLTVQKGIKNEKIKPENISLKTPDGKVVPMMDQKAYSKAGNLRNLNTRANYFNDSINYFPPMVQHACRIGFFSNPTNPGSTALAFGEVELSPDRACVGRIFFELPNGIQEGQHWVLVQFADSALEVPFNIFSKEEEKEFRKKWQALKKAYDQEQDQ